MKPITKKLKVKSLKKSRKNVPWKGWKDVKPTFHGKTIMKKKCGKKCFLGPNKSFPICDMNTCKVDKKGVWAAYVRAKEWETRSKLVRNKKPSFYSDIAKQAKEMI
jgi:hypothetical protein